MLRPSEDGSFGDSNGRVYAIAASFGQASRPFGGGGVENGVLKPLSKWRGVWGEVNRFTRRSPISVHGLAQFMPIQQLL